MQEKFFSLQDHQKHRELQWKDIRCQEQNLRLCQFSMVHSLVPLSLPENHLMMTSHLMMASLQIDSGIKSLQNKNRN